MEIISFGIFDGIFHIHFRFTLPFFVSSKIQITAQATFRISVTGLVKSLTVAFRCMKGPGGRDGSGGVSWGFFIGWTATFLWWKFHFIPNLWANDPFWRTFFSNELKPRTGLAFGTKVDMFRTIFGFFWTLILPKVSADVSILCHHCF